MNNYRVRMCWVITLVWAGVLIAAPVVTHQIKVPDRVLSLAKLQQIQLEILPVPPMIVQTGVSKEVINRSWVSKLTKAGYQVVNDPLAPKLSVLILGGGEPKVPDAIAFSIQVELAQQVYIERLDKSLFVPTYIITVGALEHKQDAGASVYKVLDKMFRKFVRSAAVASSLP